MAKERTLRHDWTKEELLEIYNKPLMELIYEAATVHREWHKADEIQISTLLSVKTGAVLKIVLIADRPRAIIQILKYRHFCLQQP